MAIVRLQVEIESDQMQELERLGELGGLRTKKDLVNNAFTLLRWAAKQKAEGCAIVSVNDDNGNSKELQMPFLEEVAANSGSSRSRRRPASEQHRGSQTASVANTPVDSVEPEKELQSV